MIKEKESSRGRNAFTLVELLAVIVILAIILVIAVPKVMSIIEDAKKGTLESTAKMIASGAEKQKIQNTVLGKTEEITCDSVAKINKGDYTSCSIIFDNNTAKVTIEGDGKFDGLWVCGGTKTSSEAIKQECTPGIKELEVVQNKLFNLNEEITTDELEVIAKFEDGTTRKLNNGTETYLGEEDAVEVTSPNYPENYPNNMTEEEIYWEYTFEGATQIQFELNELFINWNDYSPDCIYLYDKLGNKIGGCGSYTNLNGIRKINGDYVKVTMKSGSEYTAKGFKATITPIYNTEPEYNVVVNERNESEKTIDTTISVDLNVLPNNGKEVNKNVSLLAGPRLANEYIEYLNTKEQKLKNGLYVDDTSDKNIRYVGSKPNNKVYFDCSDTDSNGVNYGEDNYNYANSCKVWNIIGLFNTKITEESTFEKRIKIVGNNLGYMGFSGGNGNWTKSSLVTYLNEEYYGNLSTTTKSQIQDVIWNLGGVASGDAITPLSSYQQERGNIVPTNSSQFDDLWLGKIGLIYPSDFGYAALNCLNILDSACSSQNWLSRSDAWTITPLVNDGMYVLYQSYKNIDYSNMIGYYSKYVYPALYLNSNIKIVSGNGDTEPYVLAM